MASAAQLKGLRPWVKGQSGNPGGRPALTEELKAIKALTYLEIARIISKYARMDSLALAPAIENGKLSVIELAIANMFNSAIRYADYQKLSFLLDRCIGKVKEVPDDEETNDSINELKKLSMNELLTLVKTNLPEGPANEISSQDPLDPFKTQPHNNS